MSQLDLEDAISGLRGWRVAGEQYANRGGKLTSLDACVDVALAELAFREDPIAAAEDGEERPTPEELATSLDEIAEHFSDSVMGSDLRIVHAALRPVAEA